MDTRSFSATGSTAGLAPGEESLPGISAAIQRINRTIREYSSGNGLVFLTGERGTERSIAAKLIHHHSARRSRPLGRLRVSWKLPPEFLQHVELCREGSLVLVLQREIPIDMQYTLVEIASHGVFVDPHSGQTVDCPDMGIILLTSQTLDELAGVRTGTVLPELKELLDARQVSIPPLRQRPEDIPALVRYAISRAKETGRCRVTGADAQVLALFRHWHWPGNAEDLLLVTAQSALSAQGDMISIKDLPEEFTAQIPPDDMDAARQVRIPRPIRKAGRRSQELTHGVDTTTLPVVPMREEVQTESPLPIDDGIDSPTPMAPPRRLAAQRTPLPVQRTPVPARRTPMPSQRTPLPIERTPIPTRAPLVPIEELEEVAMAFDPSTEPTPIPLETALPIAPMLGSPESIAMLPSRVLTLARRLGAQSQVLADQIVSSRGNSGRTSESMPRLSPQQPLESEVPATLVEEELYRGLDLVMGLRRQLAVLNTRQRDSIRTFRDLVQRLNVNSPRPEGIDPELEFEKNELERQLQSIKDIIERVSVSMPEVGAQIALQGESVARDQGDEPTQI